MPPPIAYEDAVDLLDADHKAVKKMFIDYDALCEDKASAEEKEQLALRICQALTVHAQIEEEIFYPKVREATGDDPLLDQAEQEHAQAKETIAQILAMEAGSKKYDATVKKLAKLIDEHVLEEREEIFLEARQAPLDLKELAVPLYTRKKALAKPVDAPPKKVSK